jgi:hypothetical protein
MILYPILDFLNQKSTVFHKMSGKMNEARSYNLGPMEKKQSFVTLSKVGVLFLCTTKMRVNLRNN